MTTLTIDGKRVEVAPGTNVLDAALQNGIDIPHICHHPELVPSGGCRLCLVQVEGARRPEPSCNIIAKDDMVVTTVTDEIEVMRKDLVDLFISDHPLICDRCEKDGDCALQDLAERYNITQTTFDFELSRTLFQDDNPFFVRDHQFCVLCGKCVRVCDEIVGANAIEYAGRGFDSHIATPFDVPMIDSSCVFCGSCVQVCPTKALIPRRRVEAPPVSELTGETSICVYCGVGCSIEYKKDSAGNIVYATGYPEAPVNGEFLCVKGRSGWDYATNEERLTEPLIRKDLAYELGLSDEPWTLPETSSLKLRDAKARDYFLPISWEQALDITADKIAATVRGTGPDSIATLASARCTNEENYLFQKMVRVAIGTNNVDHCARLCHASTVTGLGTAFGSGAMTNSIHEMRDADCLLITGSNTAESHPVISYEVVRAVKKGANLVIIDPRRIPLVDHATLWLQAKPGSDIHIFRAMAHVIIREGWADMDFVRARTENWDAFAAGVASATPEAAALQSGVPAEDIEKAARWYALGERAFGESIYDDGGHSSILYAMGITQRSNGTNLVLALANLAMMTGNIGKPSSGVNPLRGQANVQGACDLGGLPNVLPAYQKVTDPEKRAFVARGWEVDDLPGENGITVVEMMHAAHERRIRAMLIMGENPMLSDPNLEHVEEALRTLDFLATQDIFLSETAMLSHIVLPAASAMEKDGSFTNTERRVQLIYPVLPAPGQSKPDYWIVGELARRIDAQLGHQRRDGYWDFANASEIMADINKVAPSYAGMTYERLAGAGLAWPCPTTEHPGTPILHTAKFARGLGLFSDVPAQEPAELPDDEFPLILSTGRILFHYHTGTMTRRSEGLNWRESRGWIEVNPDDATRYGVEDGGIALVTSRRGQIRAQVRVGEGVQPGVVFMAFHWREAPANMLTQDHTLDPLAKIPEYKVAAVKIEKPAGARSKNGH